MLVNKDSIKIDGVSFGQYLTKVKFGRPKLWGNDTGRNNIAGTYTGTLIGTFPKITLYFGPLTQAQLEYVTPFLEEAEQNFTYYSNKLKRLNTIKTYSGDYEYENQNTLDNVDANEEFEISFIARSKE